MLIRIYFTLNNNPGFGWCRRAIAFDIIVESEYDTAYFFPSKCKVRLPTKNTL